MSDDDTLFLFFIILLSRMTKTISVIQMKSNTPMMMFAHLFIVSCLSWFSI